MKTLLTVFLLVYSIALFVVMGDPSEYLIAVLAYFIPIFLLFSLHQKNQTLVKIMLILFLLNSLYPMLIGLFMFEGYFYTSTGITLVDALFSIPFFITPLLATIVFFSKQFWNDF